MQMSINDTIDDVIVIVEFSMRDSRSAAMGGTPSGHQPASLAGFGASPRRPRELAGGARAPLGELDIPGPGPACLLARQPDGGVTPLPREIYIPAPGQPAFSIRALKQGGLITGETACSPQLERLAIDKEQLLTETPFSSCPSVSW